MLQQGPEELQGYVTLVIVELKWSHDFKRILLFWSADHQKVQLSN